MSKHVEHKIRAAFSDALASGPTGAVKPKPVIEKLSVMKSAAGTAPAKEKLAAFIGATPAEERAFKYDEKDQRHFELKAKLLTNYAMQNPAIRAPLRRSYLSGRSFWVGDIDQKLDVQKLFDDAVKSLEPENSKKKG